MKWIIYCLVFLNLLWAAPSRGTAVQAPKTQSDVQLLDRANEYYKQGQFQLAIPLYRKLEARGAFVLQSSFNLGNSYFQLGDLPKAAAAYRKASRLGEAENPTVLFNLGAVLYRLGQYGEAVAVYHRALRLDPENTSAWLYLAESYQRTGDLVGAQKSLEKVIQSGQSDVAAIYQLAEIFVQQKNYPRAVQIAKEGLARFPKENDLWFYLGDLERLQKNLDAALGDYRQGLLNDPKNVDVLYKMADVAAESKKIPMAMEFLEKALLYKKDFSDAYVFLGNLAYELKWKDKAYQAYLSAAKLNNAEGAQGILNLALDLQTESRAAEAIQYLKPLRTQKWQGSVGVDLNKIWAELNEVK